MGRGNEKRIKVKRGEEVKGVSEKGAQAKMKEGGTEK